MDEMIEHWKEKVKETSNLWKLWYLPDGSGKLVTVDELAEQLPDLLPFLANFGITELEAIHSLGAIRVVAITA